MINVEGNFHSVSGVNVVCAHELITVVACGCSSPNKPCASASCSCKYSTSVNQPAIFMFRSTNKIRHQALYSPCPFQSLSNPNLSNYLVIEKFTFEYPIIWKKAKSACINNMRSSAGTIRTCFGAFTQTCISDSGSLPI